MATKKRSRRGFELVIKRDPVRRDGRYGIDLVETNGRVEDSRVVARLPAERLEAAQPALADALRDSGHTKTALKPTRRTPIVLSEEAGVRVALALATISGVSKPGRTARLLDGMARLSSEECFYWYAHTIGTPDRTTARRRLKALRIFLTEE